MYSLFLFFLCSTIVSSALSVSISQLSLFFSLIFFLFAKGYKTPNLLSSPIAKISVSLFIVYTISFLFHIGSEENQLTYIQKAFHSELKDALLFSGFLCMQLVKSEDLKKIYIFFWILILLLIITGLISVFSPIRLSRLISDLYKTSLNWKFTHHYGNIFGIGIHLPIGLMNTHLTFGGLLLFFMPAIFFQPLFKFILHEKKKEIFISILLLLLFSFIFLLNNARSALMGAFGGMLIGFSENVFYTKEIPLDIFKKYILLPLLFIGIAISLLLIPEPTRKAVAPLLGKEKHTDSGRTFIWDSTFPLITKNPIFGVGPGNYNKEISKSRLVRSEQNRELLYFYEVAQRGHAHNDYLHIAAVFGLPALCLYIFLGLLILHTILNSGLPGKYKIIFYGLPALFFAGVYQCYFQDDEVVIVFWLLVGFLVRLKQNKDENKSNFDDFPNGGQPL